MKDSVFNKWEIEHPAWGLDDYTIVFLFMLALVCGGVYIFRSIKRSRCRHENAEPTLGGWHCPDCGKKEISK